MTSWYITVVYDNPRYARRHRLWDNLGIIAESMEDPWVVLGDFNAITSDKERRGELPISLLEV